MFLFEPGSQQEKNGTLKFGSSKDGLIKELFTVAYTMGGGWGPWKCSNWGESRAGVTPMPNLMGVGGGGEWLLETGRAWSLPERHLERWF